MNFCVIIPCYNHGSTLTAVAEAARRDFPVIIVDDGSTKPLPNLPDCDWVRLSRNQGKGSALRAGFQRARERGYTHAITMDADGQHFPEDLAAMHAAASAQPDAFIVGVRDLVAAGCPGHRQRSNAVSSFWFRVETGVRLPDTQCGFRCYPLALVEKLRIRSGRYAFELEFMVRAAWLGTPVLPVPVKCVYLDGIRNSHFRPVADLTHITAMNIGLVLQSWTIPLALRTAWSCGRSISPGEIICKFFTDHAEEPGRLAGAVGLGLFFGIAPFWGVQMLLAATVAHWLRWNKAITLLASNISIWPLTPFFVSGGLILGHWLFTGQVADLAHQKITIELAMKFFWQWFIGSLVLATVVSLPGAALTYLLARLFHRKRVG